MQSITLRTSYEAARLARDLKKDLAHLRRRGVDPATFLGGNVLAMTASPGEISMIF